MKNPVDDLIQELLPELFGPADKKKTGGMCAPGSGCGPAAEPAGPDLVEMLTRGARGSSPDDGEAEEKPVREKSPNGPVDDCG